MNDLRIWLQLLRVPQWSKNAVVFAALVFGNPVVDHAMWRTLVAFVAFCAVSSAGYIVNDTLDLDRDRVHPAKRRRPLASGAVSPQMALRIAAVLVAVGLLLSLTVNLRLATVVLVYMLLTFAYSWQLKHMVFVDVVVIAIGFLLRAVAGAAAVEVPVSPWLMLCTVLLALFLGFGKRRSEVMRLGSAAADHRTVLARYSARSLDVLLIGTAVCTIVAYTVYSWVSESVPPNGAMLITVPFVAFAIFRYLLLVLKRGEGGAPELLLWRDIPLLVSVMSWGVMVLVVLAIA